MSGGHHQASPYRTRSDTLKLQRLISTLKERGSDFGDVLESSASNFLGDVKKDKVPAAIPHYDPGDDSDGSSFEGYPEEKEDDEEDDCWEWEEEGSLTSTAKIESESKISSSIEQQHDYTQCSYKSLHPIKDIKPPSPPKEQPSSSPSAQARKEPSQTPTAIPSRSLKRETPERKATIQQRIEESPKENNAPSTIQQPKKEETHSQTPSPLLPTDQGIIPDPKNSEKKSESTTKSFSSTLYPGLRTKIPISRESPKASKSDLWSKSQTSVKENDSFLNKASIVPPNVDPSLEKVDGGSFAQGEQLGAVPKCVDKLGKSSKEKGKKAKTKSYNKNEQVDISKEKVSSTTSVKEAKLQSGYKGNDGSHISKLKSSKPSNKDPPASLKTNVSKLEDHLSSIQEFTKEQPLDSLSVKALDPKPSTSKSAESSTNSKKPKNGYLSSPKIPDIRKEPPRNSTVEDQTLNLIKTVDPNPSTFDLKLGGSLKNDKRSKTESPSSSKTPNKEKISELPKVSTVADQKEKHTVSRNLSTDLLKCNDKSQQTNWNSSELPQCSTPCAVPTKGVSNPKVPSESSIQKTKRVSTSSEKQSKLATDHLPIVQAPKEKPHSNQQPSSNHCTNIKLSPVKSAKKSTETKSDHNQNETSHRKKGTSDPPKVKEDSKQNKTPKAVESISREYKNNLVQSPPLKTEKQCISQNLDTHVEKKCTLNIPYDGSNKTDRISKTSKPDQKSPPALMMSPDMAASGDLPSPKVIKHVSFDVTDQSQSLLKSKKLITVVCLPETKSISVSVIPPKQIVEKDEQEVKDKKSSSSTKPVKAPATRSRKTTLAVQWRKQKEKERLNPGPED